MPVLRSTAAADAQYLEAGTPSEHLYLAATLRMTGPDALQRHQFPALVASPARFSAQPPSESGRL